MTTERKILSIGILTCIVITALVWVGGGIPAAVPKLPDQGPSWYYWKLPEPTFWSRATAWGFYLAHQIAIWACIWWAQNNKLKYTQALQPINFLMIGINLLFVGLHFLQTYVWYDGLAQDVSIFSSQGSVVVLLVLIMIMENQRRGLAFGKPAPFRKEFTRQIRKYHGYFFAWAAIYTFWYHPMEATLGHLSGFVYMFGLLLQSALIFNRAHLNRWWTFTLEFLVLVHGTVVAFIAGNGIWPMFFFGFFALVVVTQMYGLPIKNWARWLIVASFVGGVFWVYIINGRGFIQINEIVRIPIIDFVLIGVIYLIWWLGFWIWRGLSGIGKSQPA